MGNYIGLVLMLVILFIFAFWWKDLQKNNIYNHQEKRLTTSLRYLYSHGENGYI